MTRIIHPQLSYNINGCCFRAAKKLDRFASERQFADELEKEFLTSDIKYLREYQLDKLPEVERKGNRVDFFVENTIILDVKAKKFITKEDYYQMLRYLESANLELGLIVNFRSTFIKPKRVVNNRYKPN